MAANLESMGKNDEALSVLQRLTSTDPKNFVVPMALLSEVYLLKAKGKTTEARQLCEKFLTEYRESPLAQEASRQLRLLKPPQEAKPVAPPTTAAAPAVSPNVSPAPSAVLPPNPAPKKP